MTNRTWNILVIEDDPDGQDVVQRILKHHRIQFEAVYNAEDGLAILGERQFDAAIVDLALPNLDGWGFLKAVQNNPATAQMPCVAVTAFHSAEVAVEAIRNGFLAYFPKPIDPTSFVRELDRVLTEALTS